MTLETPVKPILPTEIGPHRFDGLAKVHHRPDGQGEEDGEDFLSHVAEGQIGENLIALLDGQNFEDTDRLGQSVPRGDQCPFGLARGA